MLDNFQYPQTLIRPQDGQEFIHLGNGFYKNKSLIEFLPEEYYCKWHYTALYYRGFWRRTTKEEFNKLISEEAGQCQSH